MWYTLNDNWWIYNIYCGEKLKLKINIMAPKKEWLKLFRWPPRRGSPRATFHTQKDDSIRSRENESRNVGFPNPKGVGKFSYSI